MHAKIELWRIARAAALLAFGRLAVVNLQAFQLGFNLAVALGELGADEVEQRQGLLEREQVLGAPVALQALGDLLGTGLDACVSVRGQREAITLTIPPQRRGERRELQRNPVICFYSAQLCVSLRLCGE